LTIGTILSDVSGDTAQQQSTNFDILREARFKIRHDLKLGKFTRLNGHITFPETA
jgi:hypothetical protein